MATRDSRSRNRRSKVETTKTRQRRIDQGTTTREYYGRAGVIDGEGTFSRATWDPNNPIDYSSTFATNKTGADVHANMAGGTHPDKYYTENGDVGTLHVLDKGGSKRYGSGVYAEKLVVEHKNPDKIVNDTYTDTRLQASDSLSKDGNSQDQKKLKTKREGRNKLRISLSGDSSSARIKGGPNSGRRQNKLKIDVQGGGGNTGLNVPR